MPVLCIAQAQQKNLVERPNIIFVLVDDLRWDAMGFVGRYPFLKTPHIDKLRKEGVHFKNAYCTNSLCAPSRATFLTGMFPQTNGVNTNQEGRELNPDKTLSFGQILQGEVFDPAGHRRIFLCGHHPICFFRMGDPVYQYHVFPDEHRDQCPCDHDLLQQ